MSVRVEWQRSWPLVGLTALALTSSPATLPVYSIGVLTEPLQAEFGWSRATIQAAITFSTGLGLIGGPLGGWMVDKFGVRNAILLGIVGLCLSVLGCAAMTGAAWQFYLSYATMAVLGAGAGAVSWTFLIADRFEKSRGLALGVALSGTGLAAVLAPRIAAAGLDWGGWQGAYLWLAGFGLLLILPLCAIGLPRRSVTKDTATIDTAQPSPPAVPRTGLTLRQAVRSRHFWLIGVATFVSMSLSGVSFPTWFRHLLTTGCHRTRLLQSWASSASLSSPDELPWDIWSINFGHRWSQRSC